MSLWLGCELALCSAVIVNGVDLQNYYSKEPDFQIGITEEACNYLIESSPDTKNMKFFPKSLMNDIETTIGNELHSVENIKGFYPIVGKNGKENIKILIDGDIINVDVSTILNGYFSDASRMFTIGDVSPEAERIVRVTKECVR